MFILYGIKKICRIQLKKKKVAITTIQNGGVK